MRGFTCHYLRAYLRANPLPVTLPPEMEIHLVGCSDCRSRWEYLTHMSHRLTEDAERNLLPLFHEEEARVRLMEQVQREGKKLPTGSHTQVQWIPSFAVGVTVLAGLTFLVYRFTPFSPLTEKEMAPATANRSSSRSYKTVKMSGHPASLSAKPATKLPVQSPMKALLPANDPQQIPPFHPRKPQVASSKGLRQPVQPKKQSSVTEQPLFPRIDDLAYINVSESSHQSLSPPTKPEILGDDFITIPLPQLAAAGDTPTTRRAIKEAINRYEAERAIVDPRLTTKVTVEMKGGDLKELMESLSQKAGVRFYVNKKMEDLKLTVITKDTPTRDLMRQIVKLFNLEWRRAGEDGRYRYTLVQTLKQKLVEEEFKRKDNDQMLLNVIDEVEPYLVYKDMPDEQIQSLAEEAKQHASVAGSVEERERLLKRSRILTDLTQARFKDSLRLFAEFTPDQLLSLQHGEVIQLSYTGASNDVPREVAERLKNDIYRNPRDDEEKKRLEGSVDDLDITFIFRLQPMSPGRVDLTFEWKLLTRGTTRGDLRGRPFISGQPDGLRNPDNRTAHAALAARPEYRSGFGILPHALEMERAVENPNTGFMLRVTDPLKPGREDLPPERKKWVDSGDFFAELHKKTGRSIIADYYTRVYPSGDFTFPKDRLLDILNSSADLLKSAWQPDGKFLRFRRHNYYSERAIDIPNRLLRKWETVRRDRGILGLEELAEVSVYSDTVLSHQDFLLAVMLKHGLDEMPLAQRAREDLQLYAALSPAQRQQARSETGVFLASLIPIRRDQVKHFFNPYSPSLSDTQLAGIRFHIRLREPDIYEWFDWEDKQTMALFPLRIPVRENSREKAQAAVTDLLKAKGSSDLNIRAEQAAIRGPGAGIWCQASLENYLNLRLTDVNGFQNWEGSVSKDMDNAAGSLFGRIPDQQ